MPKPRTVKLVGGPYDGRTMLVIGQGVVVVDEDRTPDGIVACYRPSKQGRYRFSTLATVFDRTLERAA